MKFALLGVVAIAIGLMLAGCGRDDQIVAYSAPKESTTAPVADVSSPMDVQSPQAPRVTWTMPPGWHEVPSEQQMRYATIQVAADHPDVVMTITPLPADASEVSALKPNVLRWENQLGLPPSDDAHLASIVRQFKVNGVSFDVIDLTGSSTQSPQMEMMTAMATVGEKVWFFKLAGPVDVVKSQTKNFGAFVQSIRFETVAASAASASAGGPVGAVGSDTTFSNETAGSPADAGAAWTAPSTWTAESPKPMRVASFKAPADTEIIITKFPGDLGGVLANVNRWRGQVGLPDVASESDAKPQATIQLGGHDANIFDIPGSEKRLRVAMVKVNDDTWFFKLQGTVSAVQQQQDAFDSFLKTVKFGGDSK